MPSVSRIPLSEFVETAADAAPQDQPGELQVLDLERRRLARDLHNGPAQIMTGIALLVSDLAETEPSVARKEKLTDVLRLAERCARELQSISCGLLSPVVEELGLEAGGATIEADFPLES